MLWRMAITSQDIVAVADTLTSFSDEEKADPEIQASDLSSQHCHWLTRYKQYWIRQKSRSIRKKMTNGILDAVSGLVWTTARAVGGRSLPERQVTLHLGTQVD